MKKSNMFSTMDNSARKEITSAKSFANLLKTKIMHGGEYY